MTRCVVFRTPGLIPLESFTTFGVNVKPNTPTPFGYFGTGLKYAIAVCLRHGCRVVMWRGTIKYTFYIREEDFRGKNFAFVRMKRESFSLSQIMPTRASYDKLPFTTELGKNWELWQAFRELETNTRDEGGSTELLSDVNWHPVPDQTVIAVYGDRFVDEYLDMGKHFLADGKHVRDDEAIQIIERPSRHIYYRGVRIMDLKEEAQFTYNILSHVDLTEDRTAKYPFLIESMIADHWIESDNEEQLSAVVRTNRWESRGLSYAYATSTPSPTFRRFAPQYENPTAKQFLQERDPTVSTTTTVQIIVPKPEVTPNELADIARAVNEVLGLDRVKIKNLSTDDVWETQEEYESEQPEKQETDEEDYVPY